MGMITICGGGPVGLLSALMLAKDGHQVTVLENDEGGAPGDVRAAWEDWQRAGVAQFRQPHNLFARFREVCDRELPWLTGKLLDAGCVWVDYVTILPPPVTDREPRAGDDRFRFVTGRRPVIEAVLAAAAQEEPGVTVRRGVRAAGFLRGASALPGVPHVAGVRTTDGEELRADLVVDAMGRRSPGVRMLTGLGARPPETQAEDCGFVYYTRYFTGPERPALRARALCPIGTITLLTLDGDNDTWSVTVYSSTRDPAVKALRDPEKFERVLRACPAYAHWHDGTPITPVLPMAGILDRYHRFVVDGRPVATGYAAVGDAWACTNPSAGRGISVGAVHAQQLRRTVARHLDDPATFARAWDEVCEQVVAPFYWNQVNADRARIAEMDALRHGQVVPRPESPMDRLSTAAAFDADVFRGLLEIVLCLAQPQEVLNRPELKDKIERWGYQGAPPSMGPDRAELLELLSS